MSNTTIYSTAPVLYEALSTLVTQAAAQYSPPVLVAQFEIMQDEPNAYILLSGIRQQRFEVETLSTQSTMAFTETYEIYGLTTVYTGDSPDPLNNVVAGPTMDATYQVFQQCVLTPAMNNRMAPIWNYYSPNVDPGAVNFMVPETVDYSAGPGWMGEGESGWAGVLSWSFFLRAYVSLRSS
jgi:hypothetical protein